MPIRHPAAPLLSALLVAAVTTMPGCAAQNAPQPIAQRHFDCGDGRLGHIAWRPGQAVVAFEGETWALPLARSGSGARYADGQREIWERQGTLHLTIGQAAPLRCHFKSNR